MVKKSENTDYCELFTIHEVFIDHIWILQICSVDHIDEQFSIYMCKLFSLTTFSIWYRVGCVAT